MRGALILLAAGVAWRGVAWGQEFEVASIHPTNPDSRQIGIRFISGAVSANNITLRLLIEQAYQLKPFQLSGGPGWVESERFDIQAKGPDGATADRLRAMLQRLLQERFGLRMRRESKQQDIYVLLRRGELKLGPAKAPGRSKMGARAGANRSVQTNFLSYTMAQFADTLAREVNRPVVDETGLDGQFDFSIQAEREPEEQIVFRAPLAPSIGQLGLRLDSRRGMVDVYTIEAVERPSEN